MKILYLTIVLFLIYLSDLNAKTLVFSTIIKLPLAEPLSQILSEAYGKAGFRIKCEELPAKRSLFYANSGAIDGELGRRKGKEIKFKNLLRIDVPLFYSDIVVFTKIRDLKVKGWQSLKPYTIGVLRGMECTEKGTDGMQRFIINNPHQLARMLAHDRIDTAVMQKSFGLTGLKNKEFKGIIMKEPPLARYPVFHYIHRKNKYLISVIENILLEMKKKGRMKKVLKNFVKRQAKK